MADEELALEQKETADEESEQSKEEQAMARLKEAITVSKEDLGSLRLKLTITVPAETLSERRGEQFAELRRDALIPGFRKGRAPLALVEKRFASDVGEQLKTQIVSSGYLAAVDKEELKTLGDPLFLARVKEERVGEDGKPRQVEGDRLLPLDKALDHIHMPKEGDLTFSCEVELKPQFELPELTGVPVDKPRIEIDDDDIDEEVRRFCMLRGTFEPVESGDIERNDMLIADTRMIVEGQVIFSEENFDLAARDVRIKGVPLTGFGDEAEGKPLNTTITFEAKVPDDHEDLNLRGKTARFEFVTREVKRLSVPEVNDELLKTFGFESEDELRSMIRTSLESRLDATLNRGMRQQVAAYLLEKTALDIPAGLSERQTNRSLARRMIELYRQGVPEAEIDRRMDEERPKAREQAVKDLKLFFILEKIAEAREIEVPEERLNAAIAEIAKDTNRRFDRVRDELSKGDGMMLLYIQLRDEAVLDALLKDAKITETEGPKKTTAAKKPIPKKTDKEKTTKETQTKKPATEKKSEKAPGAAAAKASTGKKPAEKKEPPQKPAAKKTAKKKTGR